MKFFQHVVPALLKRRQFLLAAVIKSSPQLIACAAAGFAVYALVEEDSLTSVVGVLKAVGFVVLAIYYLISLYEAWRTANET